MASTSAASQRNKCVRVAVRVRPLAGSSDRVVHVEQDATGPYLRLTERLTDSFGKQQVTEAAYRYVI
jgi:hypothetical protein